MINWRSIANLQIFKSLTFKRNAVMKIQNKDGTFTELDVAELGGGLETVTGLTALASGGQSGATQLLAGYSNITTVATAGDSVLLPQAEKGRQSIIKNSGAASMAVFPSTSDSINALAVNLSINIPSGGEATFTAISDVVWETNEVLSVPSPTTQDGELGLKSVNNAGDYEILISNASMGQSTVVTIPDPGAATGTFVLLEGTSTIAGVKTFTSPIVTDSNTTITAFAGGRSR